MIENISVISKFKFIQCLNASKNKLRDLSANMLILKKLDCLTNLNLSMNPLSEEPNYKRKVIKILPHLEVFDLHGIIIFSC